MIGNWDRHKFSKANAPSGARVKAVAMIDKPLKIFAADGTSSADQVIPVNVTTTLKGVPKDGQAGKFKWSTKSEKIRLEDTDKQVVKVIAGGDVSSKLDAESISLQFTSNDGNSTYRASTSLTVIKVTFSKAAGQKYGYDEIDNAAGTLPHVSVKMLDKTTVKLVIVGGASGSVLSFTSDDAATADATPPNSPGAAFDLVINGKNKDKAETTIHARANRATGPICASIKINVYKEVALGVTVAKLYDSTSAGTTLSRPKFDVAKAQQVINKMFQNAVVKFKLKDLSTTGDAIDVAYDKSGDGTFTLEAGGAGEEMAVIKAKLKELDPAGSLRVVIVKKMTYIYYLETAAAKGARKIKLKSTYGGNIDFLTAKNPREVGSGSYQLGVGANSEKIVIIAKNANELELGSPLKKAHATTEGVLLSVMGLGGNPVLISEVTTNTVALEQEVIAHELGHAASAVKWSDVNDDDNLMYHTEGNTDTRIRYKDQTHHYPPYDTVNQWQVVKR